MINGGGFGVELLKDGFYVIECAFVRKTGSEVHEGERELLINPTFPLDSTKFAVRPQCVSLLHFLSACSRARSLALHSPLRVASSPLICTPQREMKVRNFRLVPFVAHRSSKMGFWHFR